MSNCYRHSVPHSAETEVPLLECIKGNKKKDKTPTICTRDILDPFRKCKDELINANLWTHPADNAHICVMVDTSDSAIGER